MLDYETKVDKENLDQITKTVYDLEKPELFIKKISKLMKIES